MPSDLASAPPTPVRLGPATAPIVVAQTTTDRARARCSSVARSVAAYRDPLLTAVVAPSSTAPASSTSIDPTTPATTASTAPTAPAR